MSTANLGTYAGLLKDMYADVFNELFPVISFKETKKNIKVKYGIVFYKEHKNKLKDLLIWTK